MKAKKYVAAALALLISATSLPVSANTSSDISPGIDWIRKNVKIEKSGIINQEYKISKHDFEKAVGFSIDSFTVTKLPNREDGRLCIRGIDVIEGQTVTSSSMDYLTFVPAENKDSATFGVKLLADGWEDVVLPYSISFGETVNTNPVLNGASAETVSGVCCGISLDVFDPDGDSTDIEIVSYPQNGTVKINGNKAIYTPQNGFVGTDTMTVIATDKFGNASAPSTLEFKVEHNSSQIVFADMKDNGAHAAALALAENSIVAFTKKDGEYYFSPEKAVSNVDLMVMLLCAANITPDKNTQTTLLYTDLENVPTAKLDYIKKAVEMGIITNSGGKFNPDENATRLTFATWACKLVNASVKNPNLITDMKNYTETQRFYATAMAEAGMILAENGCFLPENGLTKGELATALYLVHGMSSK